MRIGERISKAVSKEEIKGLDEAENLEQGIAWLSTHVPHYRDIVSEETYIIHDEILSGRLDSAGKKTNAEDKKADTKPQK